MSLLRDLVFAARSLRRAPGYTLTFVVTLALGLGATTAIFSVIDGVLLRPLPYEHGDRLVYLRQSLERQGVDNILFSVPEIDDYRQQVPGFDGVAEFSALDFTMLGHDDPRVVRVGIVTGNYFEVLGLGAALGRPLGENDDPETSEPVAVLTHAFWQREFGGDAAVIGQTVTMNNRSVRIVGVASPAPPYPERTDLYVNMVASPHHMSASMNHDRAHRMTEIFARMAPGATLEDVRGQIDTVTARIHADYPGDYDEAYGYNVAATAFTDQLAARARPTMLLLLGAAAFVMLVACANVANLTLTRVQRRYEELAVRASLGASPRRLRRQLLAEALLPSAVGGLLGLGIGLAGLDMLVSYASRFSVRASEIAFDARTFLVAAALVTASACFFAMVPRLPSSLAGSNRGASAGAAGRRTQRALAVAQIAVSFVLVIGAGLLLRSLLNLQALPVGVDTENVISMEVPGSFWSLQSDEVLAGYQELVRLIEETPGVTGVALANSVPLNTAADGLRAAFEVRAQDNEPEAGQPLPRADFRVVSADYFEALGARILAGRPLQDTDTRDAARVVVINETAARRLFPDGDPVGRRIAWAGDVVRFLGLSDDWLTVVGVVADAQDFGVGTEPPAAVFHPITQETTASALFVRTGDHADTGHVVDSTLAAVRSLNPDQPIENVATLEELRADSIAPQRLNLNLVGLFALTGLAIAAVGIGAMLAFTVSQRRRELGIRAALGADRQRLLRSVLREGATIALAGIAAGAILSTGVERLLGSFLYDVDATDPVTFVATALLLAAIAVLAAYVPARRAAAADPASTLRSE